MISDSILIKIKEVSIRDSYRYNYKILKLFKDTFLSDNRNGSFYAILTATTDIVPDKNIYADLIIGFAICKIKFITKNDKVSFEILEICEDNGFKMGFVTDNIVESYLSKGYNNCADSYEPLFLLLNCYYKYIWSKNINE